MSTPLRSALSASIIAILLCHADSAQAQRRNWLIVGSYWPETGAALMLEQFGVFDSVAAAINRRIRLQTTVTLKRDTSATPNSYYERKSGETSIRVTDGLVDEAARYAILDAAGGLSYSDTARPLYDQGNRIGGPGQAIALGAMFATAAVGHAVLHEVGHALLDLLNLPVLGRREDAADQFAAWFIITDTTRAVHYSPINLRRWLSYLSDRTGSFRGRISPEEEGGAHTTFQQRGELLVCLYLGRWGRNDSPETGPYAIPGRTAEECRQEWMTVSASWERLLRPYLRR